MITSWEQRARREGIVVKKISFPIPLPSAAVFVDRVREAITPRTKVIEFPQITNLSGQILPVRDVVRLGREKGIEVFVDGAHAFGHFPFQRDDLECDYFGCSLHKWLLAPIGTGFLYVRKAKQKSIWPLMAAAASQDNDIRKFEEIGTHPAANHNAIAAALAFHRSIGADRKIARLRYLRDRWAKALLAADPRIKVWTPLGDDAPSGGIGLVQIQGIDSGKLAEYLWDKHRIVTIAIKHAQFEGIRVTPERLHHARRGRHLHRRHEAGPGRASDRIAFRLERVGGTIPKHEVNSAFTDRSPAMSTSVATQTQYTPEDLLAMPDGKSYELVGGQLVERKMGVESELGGRPVTLAARPVLRGAWTGMGLVARHRLSVLPSRTGPRPQARCLVRSLRSLPRRSVTQGLGQDPSRPRG